MTENGDAPRYDQRDKLDKNMTQRFRKILRAIPDPAFLLNQEGVFVDVNMTALERLGFTREEIIGSSLWDTPFLPAEAVETTTENFERRRQGEEIPPYIVKVQTKQGDYIVVEINVGKFEEDSFEGEIVIGRDITERKKKEEKLKEMETKLEELHDWAQRLNKADTMDAIFEYTLDAIEKTLGFKYGGVWMREGATLNVKKHRGYDTLPEEGREMPINGTGIIPKATRRVETIQLGNVSEDPEYLPASPHIKSELAVPINLERQVVGVINVESERKNWFNSNDRQLLETLAAHVAVAIKRLQEREKRVSLQRLDRMRNRFLAMAAHEINTPLTPIKSNLEMLLQGYYEELTDEQARKVKKTLESVNRLTRMVADFRRISGLRTGRIQLVKRRHQLLATVKKATERYQKVLQEEDVSMTIEVPPSLSAVYDEDHIIQVIRNLVENAIDYTDDKIWIEGREGDGKITLSVRDNGVGIPEGEQGKIFEPFYRVEKGRSRENRRYGGTGIGLAVSRQILRAHGGGLLVTSTPAKGSTFTIRLPRKEE